jgi:hypothetical protein
MLFTNKGYSIKNELYLGVSIAIVGIFFFLLSSKKNLLFFSVKNNIKSGLILKFNFSKNLKFDTEKFVKIPDLISNNFFTTEKK